MMDIKEALQIVLELAQQNVIGPHADGCNSHADENRRQVEAIAVVEDMAVNQFGDD